MTECKLAAPKRLVCQARTTLVSQLPEGMVVLLMGRLMPLEEKPARLAVGDENDMRAVAEDLLATLRMLLLLPGLLKLLLSDEDDEDELGMTEKRGIDGVNELTLLLAAVAAEEADDECRCGAEYEWLSDRPDRFD